MRPFRPDGRHAWECSMRASPIQRLLAAGGLKLSGARNWRGMSVRGVVASACRLRPNEGKLHKCSPHPPLPILDRLRESRKRVVQEARDAAQRVASSQFTATPHATVEIHAGCSDDSPIALCLIAPMRLYSRPSDRTVIGRGGSRCSAHENCSEGGGGVPESTSRSVMSPRHSPSGGRAASGSMPVIARIRRGGGGAVRPHHPHQSLGQVGS